MTKKKAPLATEVKSTLKKNSENVVTYNGRVLPRKDCILIKNVYYKLGNINIENSGDVFNINGVFLKHSEVVWNYSTLQYVNPNTINLVNGAVEYNAPNFKNGFFEYDPAKTIRIIIEGVVALGIGKHILPKNYRYNPITGIYEADFRITGPIKNTMIQGRHSKIEYSSYDLSLYGSDHNHAMVRAQEEYDNYVKTINGSVLDKYFKNRTIGVEIETSGGSVPETFLHEVGFVPVRDGSISGHEYISPILYSGGIINYLKSIFTNFSENCATNAFCSLHYHIGNLPRTKEFIVAFYTLYLRLEDEIESIIPPYKRDLHFLANKPARDGRDGRAPKDHCKMMPYIDFRSKGVDGTLYNILQYLNEGQPVSPLDQKRLRFIHIKQGRPKWDWTTRYYSVNLLPYFFENKETIEFRLYPGTLNYIKALAWLFICNAVITFASENADLIFEMKEKILLSDVINIYDNDDLVSFLNEFVNTQKEARFISNIGDDKIGNLFTSDASYQIKNPF